MPNTTNWNIYYPDISTKPEMNTVIAGTASSVETALDNVVADRQLHSFLVANATELNALTPVAGDTAYQQDVGTLYVYTGSVWRPYSSTDTGWVTLPYASGFKTHASAPKIEYRVKDGVFYLRGGGTNDAEALAPGTIYAMVDAGVLPAEYRPVDMPISGAAYGNSGRTGGMNVEISGAINFATNNGTTGNASYIRGSVSYPI